MVHFYFFLVGSIVASFLGLVVDRFPEQSIIVPSSLLELTGGCLFLVTSLGYLNINQLILLVSGMTLSLYDQRHQEYPLLIWLFSHVLLLFLTGFNLLMAIFLALGILTHFIDLRIGAGDFLFLASCSAIFNLTEVLLVLQISSIIGLFLFCLKSRKDRLAFIPCLFGASSILILIKFVVFHQNILCLI